MNNPHGPSGALGLAGRLTRTFILSPLTPLFLLASLAVGMIALVSLPREEEPQISVPMVDIHVDTSGLKAQDALKLVTEPLETIVKGIDQVEHVYSDSRDDHVMVSARFMVGVSSDTAILRVRDKIMANLDRIPLGIPEPLVVGRGINDVAIVALTFSPAEGNEGMMPSDLTRIVKEVEVRLARIENVGLTYVIGGTEEALRVAPSPEKLALYGITLQQLAGKVQSANASSPAGLLRDGGDQIGLIIGKTLTTPEEIGNLELTARDGRTVYVRDVAEVGFVSDLDEKHVATLTRAGADSGVEGDHAAIDMNAEIIRRPAVTLAIAKRAGANAVTVAEEVLTRVSEMEGSIIPDSVSIEVTRDYGETANEKANELLFHLGLATVSIVILVLIAIGWREAVVVAIVIPVTILLTLFAAYIMGYTLNRVSLFALIFSIGILVDDAIVVIENIARHWGMKKPGQNRFGAAVAAVAEVGNPTIVATLTVVVALLPMLFVSGLMGPYMSPIPANASAAMIFSFFVAVMITPWLMLKIAGRAELHHDEEGAFPGGKLGKFYASIARPVLASKKVAWMFLLAVIVLSFGSLGALYTKDVTVKLLPFDNKSELAIMVDLPEGASVEATDAIVQQAARLAMSLPEVMSAQTHAGTSAPFNFNGLVRHYYLRENPEMGEVQLKLLPKTERDRTSHDIALELREIILEGITVPPGTAMKVVEPPPGPPVISTLLAEIYGPDGETRRAVAGKVREAFEEVDFIVDTDDNFGVQARRIRAEMLPSDLNFYQVNETDAAQTLQLLNSYTTVGYSHRGEGRRPIPIVIGRDRSDRVLNAETLSTPVPANALPGGRGVVELGDVVKITEEQTSFPIFRHNGYDVVMVQAELAGEYEAPLYGMMAVADKLDAMDWPEGTKPEISLHGQPSQTDHPTLLWDGEWEVTWITFRDMGAAFGVALLGIYILVVAQFGSFRLPLVILTPVPLTFLGIMIGHWLFGAPFSATSMIGFIALAGIIVRNSILLVDFIRNADDQGNVTLDILIEAGATRFKPILLTAIAAMIGAAVILVDPIFQGLAISLLFGLLSSTALTVLVIPAIYRIFKM
ncbi:MAG: efflux RND transporter permease subunit [Alphaproteobacteria bacterium]|nr:efflux RND transporter permease subunit [Alphaproteobacteria bacterium]MBU1281445.1 efflux RND transporter permease subunit [Alphaproteobacteria bacterium]MBU1573658.1 efflux RND transporter permease subunit [Alphaproteobacteria bacterium]MBU1828860.1 efflux RND transporter permease subunit [Alphaproteobacteria bacterium]MBU2080169.1 efflux RND transporter permease subunit [Alphaproteobacteria bacterium]